MKTAKDYGGSLFQEVRQYSVMSESLTWGAAATEATPVPGAHVADLAFKVKNVSQAQFASCETESIF